MTYTGCTPNVGKYEYLAALFLLLQSALPLLPPLYLTPFMKDPKTIFYVKYNSIGKILLFRTKKFSWIDSRKFLHVLGVGAEVTSKFWIRGWVNNSPTPQPPYPLHKHFSTFWHESSCDKVNHMSLSEIPCFWMVPIYAALQYKKSTESKLDRSSQCNIFSSEMTSMSRMRLQTIVVAMSRKVGCGLKLLFTVNSMWNIEETGDIYTVVTDNQAKF